ncbi:hypothetical protein PENSPDRAFT_756446 [Peniophora sp. CONT]|nr:hypothetical protein PENSPDRAFT_756446 [Peniophora sp. CONT]
MDHALIMDAEDGDAVDVARHQAEQSSSEQEDNMLSGSGDQPATVTASSLAPELLSRIFYAVADKEGLFTLKWVRLMLVCRYFREVGIAHCELWSHISIPMHRPLPRQIAQASYATRIERARGFPLSVSIKYGMEAEYLIGNRDSPLWGVVVGNMKQLSIERDRARYLGSANWDSQTSLHCFLDRLSEEKHPLLQDIILRPDRTEQAYAFEVSRLLSVSAVRTLHLALIPHTVSANHSFLTNLTLSLPRSDDIMVDLLDFLRLCPALRSLRIFELQGLYRDIDLLGLSDKVTLPTLRSFHYHGNLPVANALLTMVTLPRADDLSLKLRSIDPEGGLEKLASNLKAYFLCSPSATAGAQTLDAYEHRFFVTAFRDGQDVTTMSIVAGDQHLDPELDLEDVYFTLLPALLAAVPLACVDTRFSRIFGPANLSLDTLNVSVLSRSTLPRSTGRAVVILPPNDDVWLTLDVLYTLLSVPDVRTCITGICVDLSRLKNGGFDSEYVQGIFTRVCEHLQDAEEAGKTVGAVEVLHSAASRDDDGLIPLAMIRSLVADGVVVDGVFHLAT